MRAELLYDKILSTRNHVMRVELFVRQDNVDLSSPDEGGPFGNKNLVDLSSSDNAGPF
jgi:hypothetical protein